LTRLESVRFVPEMLEASLPPIDEFPAVLARIPRHIDLEALAREVKAFQRPRGVRCATDLVRLAFAWGPGGYSLQRVAAWAGERKIASLTEDALIQRLHKAGPFLEALTQRLLFHMGGTACWHGRVLRVSDGTSLSQQASKGTNWRVHGVYDLGRGGFTHLEVTDSHGGGALDRGKPVAGEIRIADRGYANAQAWQRFLQARDERTDFICRMRWNTIRLLDEAGRLFDLVNWLRTRPADSETHAITVWARSGKHQTPMKIRLIARRKPAPAIAAEHRRLRQHASRRQHKIDPRSLIAAEFVVLATSLPEEDVPAEEVLAVYRLRWQIELAFKRLKSLLHIGKLRTRTEAGTRCWLYAHLIVALLADDLSQDFLESFPSGIG
jgi:Transposase DDE domain